MDIIKELSLVDENYFRVPKRIVKQTLESQKVQQQINIITNKALTKVKYNIKKQVALYIGTGLLGFNPFYVNLIYNIYNTNGDPINYLIEYYFKSEIVKS